MAYALASIVLTLASSVQALTIGTPENGNCFPFGCMGWGPQPGTRYQQIYSSAEFSGPISITQISFDLFPSISDVQAGGTYRMSLSTTATPLAGLSSVFSQNVGRDNQLFTESVHVVGPAPTRLVFRGAPFFYDPSQGNLLLDIEVLDVTHPDGMRAQRNGAFYASQHGSAVGSFSRITDFSEQPVAAEGWGLVTTFVPEHGSGLLVCFGLGLLAHGRRRARA